MHNNNRLYAYPTNSNKKAGITTLVPKNKYLCEVTVDVVKQIIWGGCVNLTDKNKPTKGIPRKVGSKNPCENDDEVDVWMAAKGKTPSVNPVSEMKVEPLAEEEDNCDNAFGEYGHKEGVTGKANNQICPEGFRPEGEDDDDKP